MDLNKRCLFDYLLTKIQVYHTLIEMKSPLARKIFLSLSDVLEILIRKLRGAAVLSDPQDLLSIIDFEKQNWQNVRPCFVLSTGRTGTLLLNRLLLTSTNAYSVHQPKPELIRVSKRAYEGVKCSPEIFIETFKSSREELVFKAAFHKKVFIETNNRITFFSPIIRKVFPNAVFIHLVRHPGDFVRSGIRRNWYTGEHDHDLGRILPISGEAKKNWEKYSIIQKIGWLWNETNQFIETFSSTLETKNFQFVKAEDLFSQVQITEQIFNFLQLDGFDSTRVKKNIRKPVNAQKKKQYPKFMDWPEKDKQELQQVTPLAKKYGYNL